MDAIRFVVRQYRFEIAAIAAMLILVGVAVQAATFRVDASRPAADCLIGWRDIEVETSRCIPLLESWRESIPLDMHQVIGAVAVIAGLVLGSALVSREIEHGTAQLAWSMSPSRTRWLLERVVPVACFLVVGLALMAAVSELHEAAIEPTIDPRASFDHYGARGIPLVLRGLAAFALSVFAGAIVGTQLPGIIAGGALVAVMIFGLSAGFPYLAQPTLRDGDLGISGEEEVTTRSLGGGWLTADGRFLTRDEARALSPYPDDDSATYEWLAARFTNVTRLVEGNQLVEVELREALVLTGVVLGGIGAAILVVQRRRPY